jgi:hypothetical protein
MGDLLAPGFSSNYGERKLSWIYFSGTLDAAIWACELARSEGRERIYVVEPTGEFFDDPNLTDKKCPGNPTKSYRSRAPLRIVGEVTEWQGHSPERLKEMHDSLLPLLNRRKFFLERPGQDRPPLTATRGPRLPSGRSRRFKGWSQLLPRKERSRVRSC